MGADKDKTAASDSTERGFRRFRSTLRVLYHSQSPGAQRFQATVLLPVVMMPSS